MPNETKIKVVQKLISIPQVSFVDDLVYLSVGFMDTNGIGMCDFLVLQNHKTREYISIVQAWPIASAGIRINECILFGVQLNTLQLSVNDDIVLHKVAKNAPVVAPGVVHVSYADLKRTRKLFTTLKKSIVEEYIRLAIKGRMLHINKEFYIYHRGRECLLRITKIEFDSDSVDSIDELLGSLALDDAISKDINDRPISPMLNKLVKLDDRSTCHNTTRIILPTVGTSTLAQKLDNQMDSTVTDEQLVKFKTEKKVSVNDIGGLDEQLTMIRDFVERPLRQPELFESYGLKAPCGILLYGPPGTGKTLISRAIAADLNVPIFSLDSSLIMSKYIGESEAKLTELFAQAKRNAPSIIFIDEIDAMCPKRDEYARESDNRIVATFLTLLDGIGKNTTESELNGGSKNATVVVVGTTNRINIIDPALRRPGRFDKEIEIGVPNARQRTDILTRLFRNCKHNLLPSDIESLSAMCHGYVGADLAAIVNEAGLLAIHDHLAQQLEKELSSDSSSLLNILAKDPLIKSPAISINLIHCIKAQSGITPSAMRELVVDIPKVLWSDIGGNKDTVRILQEAISWPIQHADAFARMKIKPSKGILLYGPPGCSKTMLAKAVATESGLNFISIKGPEVFSKWVGESEKTIQRIFKKARQVAPCILFFDEIDAVAGKRGSGGVTDRVLTQLLVELDGAVELKDVTILAATNLPYAIDPALLRAGRLDRHLYIPLPDHPSRSDIFRVYLSKMPLDFELLPTILSEFATLSDKFTGAEIENVCREAALNAMRGNIHCNTVSKLNCIIAINAFKPRTDLAMLNMYTSFNNKS